MYHQNKLPHICYSLLLLNLTLISCLFLKFVPFVVASSIMQRIYTATNERAQVRKSSKSQPCATDKIEYTVNDRNMHMACIGTWERSHVAVFIVGNKPSTHR